MDEENLELSPEELIEINNDLVIKFLTKSETSSGDKRVSHLKIAYKLLEKNLIILGADTKR